MSSLVLYYFHGAPSLTILSNFRLLMVPFEVTDIVAVILVGNVDQHELVENPQLLIDSLKANTGRDDLLFEKVRWASVWVSRMFASHALSRL
jgi:hypothetical protein